MRPAVKDLLGADRLLVREVLEQGLASGETALLLDSLDETHDRRGVVVGEIAGFWNIAATTSGTTARATRYTAT
ncbi:hypothetical protein CC117_27270 [Parafrankia colletiae]|uniref:Uncharacterized protein n=1 Tax=Parafrankia colletiae TaxID=573497 RepID=A0A1S1QC78_9ACTN|nr:hypothetical protein [Parafrankia colletiae]MCK9905101.1 hypothetical protein [Frankia sp. Cpl3]OHV30825.1 hypothetical protein CC117_27270 [Parafrankia colletiae]